MRGLILRGVGGFYSVRPEDGPGGPYLCRARGIFKKRGLTPTVGDHVEFEALDEDEGVVNAILPRRNLFIRPPIANVELFIVMIAAAEPAPNPVIVDRLLVSAEMAGVDAALCVNKIDLVSPDRLKAITDVYGGLYDTVGICCASGAGVGDLLPLLAGRRSALAGPSGAGKSTLVNRLRGRAELETGEVSDKTKRGRHVTRHVELFDIDAAGGMVFDTPGFTSFSVVGVEVSELAFFYPEMREHIGACRFDDCRHLKEPGCSVRDALSDGRIAASRYASYVALLEERGDAAPR
jgi:ribosome biogenesis GTPase